MKLILKVADPVKRFEKRLRELETPMESSRWVQLWLDGSTSQGEQSSCSDSGIGQAPLAFASDAIDTHKHLKDSTHAKDIETADSTRGLEWPTLPLTLLTTKADQSMNDASCSPEIISRVSPHARRRPSRQRSQADASLPQRPWLLPLSCFDKNPLCPHAMQTNSGQPLQIQTATAQHNLPYGPLLRRSQRLAEKGNIRKIRIVVQMSKRVQVKGKRN